MNGHHHEQESEHSHSESYREPNTSQSVPSIQRQAGNTAIADLVRESISGVGRPLEDGVRAEMEGHFGQSFDDVRIHTGPTADRSARALQARAYTRGSDIVFRDGAYDHGSSSGRHRLAHELTHVVQQRNGPVNGAPVAGMRVSDPADSWEREADEVADHIAAAHPSADLRLAVMRALDGRRDNHVTVSRWWEPSATEMRGFDLDSLVDLYTSGSIRGDAAKAVIRTRTGLMGDDRDRLIDALDSATHLAIRYTGNPRPSGDPGWPIRHLEWRVRNASAHGRQNPTREPQSESHPRPRPAPAAVKVEFPLGTLWEASRELRYFRIDGSIDGKLEVSVVRPDLAPGGAEVAVNQQRVEWSQRVRELGEVEFELVGEFGRRGQGTAGLKIKLGDAATAQVNVFEAHNRGGRHVIDIGSLTLDVHLPDVEVPPPPNTPAMGAARLKSKAQLRLAPSLEQIARDATRLGIGAAGAAVSGTALEMTAAVVLVGGAIYALIRDDGTVDTRAPSAAQQPRPLEDERSGMAPPVPSYSFEIEIREFFAQQSRAQIASLVQAYTVQTIPAPHERGFFWERPQMMESIDQVEGFVDGFRAILLFHGTGRHDPYDEDCEIPPFVGDIWTISPGRIRIHKPETYRSYRTGIREAALQWNASLTAGQRESLLHHPETADQLLQDLESWKDRARRRGLE